MEQKLLHGLDEDDLKRIINKISSDYASQFKFAYYDYDDIKQEISNMIIDALPRFDKKKGSLMNFLYQHVRRRLITLRRDKFERYDKPCLNCPLKAWDKNKKICKKFDNTDDCEILMKWVNRNTSRKNIISPADINNINDTNESFVCSQLHAIDKIEYEEYIDIIDKKLPVEHRKTYVMLKYGFRISKERKQELFLLITQILNGEI